MLLAGVVVSRLYAREQFVSGLDAASYLLAMQDYSIAAERPHPPGYPLYSAVLCKLSGEERGYRLDPDGAWRPDLEHAASLVDARTRAMTACPLPADRWCFRNSASSTD